MSRLLFVVILAVPFLAACSSTPTVVEPDDPVFPQELYPTNPVAGILVTEEPPPAPPSLPPAGLVDPTPTLEPTPEPTPEVTITPSPTPEPFPWEGAYWILVEPDGKHTKLLAHWWEQCLAIHSEPNESSEQLVCLEPTSDPIVDLGEEDVLEPTGRFFEDNYPMSHLWKKVRAPEGTVGWMIRLYTGTPVPGWITAPGFEVSGPHLIIDWTAPHDGGYSITSYDLRQRLDDFGDWIVTEGVWVEGMPTGLDENHFAYYMGLPPPAMFREVQVRAVNEFGPGPWSGVLALLTEGGYTKQVPAPNLYLQFDPLEFE